MEKIGIIIGRFQVPELHQGHKYLIQSTINNFDDTIIFIGETKDKILTAHDPLPFEARKRVIIENFPELNGKIYSLPDLGDWKAWVKQLDTRIEMLQTLNVIPKDSNIYICGSRDSVPERYKEFNGIFDIHIFPPLKNLSGTKEREKYKNYKPTWTLEERKLMTWYFTHISG